MVSFRSSSLLLLISSLFAFHSFSSITSIKADDSSIASSSSDLSINAVDCSPQHVVTLRDISKQSCPIVRAIKGHECRVNRRAARAELKQCTNEDVQEPKDETEEMTVNSVDAENEESTSIGSSSSTAAAVGVVSSQPTSSSLSTETTAAEDESFESNQSTCSPQQVILLRDVANQSCPAIRVFAGHRCRVNRRQARQQLRECLGSTAFLVTEAEADDEDEELSAIQPVDESSSDAFTSSADASPVDDMEINSFDDFMILQSGRCSAQRVEMLRQRANKRCPIIIGRGRCKKERRQAKALLAQCLL